MLSLKQIQHDKFYIDCQDNATLRECVKLLPYDKDEILFIRQRDPEYIDPKKYTIAICKNKTYFTVYGKGLQKSLPIYKHTDISELAHLHSNWYDNVHIMD